MAKTSNLTLPVTISGDGIVSFSYAPPGGALINPSAPYGGTVPLALASGDNTISVPAGAQGLMLVPPTGSVVVKKIKGAGGDTGVTISPSLPSLLSLPTAPGPIIVNASSTETVTLLWL